MKKHNDSDTLFREYPNMPSEFTKIMDEKDTRKFMREQYQMLQLQRREENIRKIHGLLLAS